MILQTVSLIANVTHYKGHNVLGSDSELFVRLPSDMKFFRKITTQTDQTVLVMGRKTWFSIPASQRPLEDRYSVILTNDKDLLGDAGGPSHKFMTFDKFCKWHKKELKRSVFIIGGGQVYSMFLNLPMDHPLKPTQLYITDTTPDKNIVPGKDLVFFGGIPQDYSLVYATEKYSEMSCKFRFLRYNLNDMESTENVYLDLLRDVLANGSSREDRTSVGTFSVFGRQTRIDISRTIPLVTTKYVPWKSCIQELLWFLRGDTDSKILSNKGVNIWNGNSSREFLDARGLTYSEGVLGPVYGWQWRFFGADYNERFSDTRDVSDTSAIGGVDQIARVEHLLQNDPFSRRIIVTAWNPVDTAKAALPPCHHFFQFYVTKTLSGLVLNCHYNMRSNDLFLGAPWNILSYAVLTYILAARNGMKPGELVYSCTDVHIYKNHILPVEEQLTRAVRSAPKLLLGPAVATKPLEQLTVDDFDIVGYFPDEKISAPMAV